MKNAYNEYIADAIRYIQSRDIKNALFKLALAQQLQPGNPRAFTLAGTACQLIGNYVEAEKFYLKALSLDNKNGERYFELANAQYALKHYSEAISNYANAERLNCSDEILYEIYYIMGVYNQFVNDSKDKYSKNQSALINYNKAEAISSCSKHKRDILSYKVQIYFESGDYDNAELCAIQLKYLSPQDFNTYKLLSQLMLIRGKVAEAEGYLDEAEKNCADYARVYILLERINVYEIKAEMMSSQSEMYYGKALSICDVVLKSNAVPISILYHAKMKKADILLKKKDITGAIEVCLEIADENKSDMMIEIEKARFLLVECFASQKKYTAALKYAKLLKQSSKMDCQQHGYYTEALCKKELGDLDYMTVYDKAIAFFKNCMILNPSDQLAIRYRLKCYIDLEKYQQARDMVECLPSQEHEELLNYIQSIENSQG